MRFVARVIACLALVILLPFTPPAAAQTRIAPNESAWQAPVGTEPCAAEDRLERALADDPTLVDRRALFDALVREAERTGLLRQNATAANAFVIPVVVHIVHQGGPENISDNQVKSQIWALNRDFANTPGGPSPAVNTGIQFCLASQLPVGSPVVWSTTPGITRSNSPETYHVYGNLASETALKAIDYLPSDRYLNIWVVNTISGGGGGVAGYATFPGMVPQTLDGIVIRYQAFGSNYTPFGSGYSLYPSNDDGKIMSHEVGHYLDLLHTFHNGCAGMGDQVADTPAEQVNRTGCPTLPLTSCTAANDPIENFMDYTNDPCRFAFTAGQTARMQSAIATYRSNLVSAQNLIDVGCPSGLNALIVAAPAQVCAGGTVAFSTPASGAGYTYAWSFPGGTPSSANTQNVNVTYPTAGVYPATLTVTDGGPNSSTNSRQVYAVACTPITGPCTNWTFPNGCALSFATGAPVPFAGTATGGIEAATTMSNASGNLLFYSNGGTVYTATHTPMPNGSGLLSGASSHNGEIAVRRPGSSTQYFLFTVRQWEDGWTSNPCNYSVIDMTLNSGLGDIVPGQKNLLVSLPGAPVQTLEGQALIPHCNGVDWWYVTHAAINPNSARIYVTAVTAAGPGATTTYTIGLNTSGGSPLGAITPSLDGTRLGFIQAPSKEIAVYSFNRSTGAVATILAPTLVDAWADIAFSPDNQIVYYSYYTGTAYGVRQLQLSTMQTREIITGQACAIKSGPDGRIYLAPPGSSAIHCINYPNNFNTLNQNECGLNKSSVPMPPARLTPIYGSLPNMPVPCTTVQPAQFTYTVSACSTVTFTSQNCGGPWSWNFGDASPAGSGQTVMHTYTGTGPYTVTLTVTGASPATAQQTITLGMQPVSIAGSNSACASPYNYSAIGPMNYVYQWTVTGGVPASATGNNVDVTWGGTGGTVQLVATDPVTGCSATVTKTVGPCPVCTPPPPNMTAWYPLDEATGSAAIENVLGVTGFDVNAPAHIVGKVRRARAFNGSNQYVQANDAPSLNFGTGDLTIDAWVRTTNAGPLQPIVTKLFPDPELGYALYLKNGRLALRLGDGGPATGTEYWSNTTPFVADGQWHHVAGVARRSGAGAGTRLHVDGVQVASFPAFTGGSITNTEKLRIGAWPAYPPAPPLAYFAGDIDEVELFQRAHGAATLQGLYLADSAGKCKEFSYVPTVASLCRDRNDVTLTLKVCNYTGSTQAYNLSFAGLPVGPCSYAGPTTFQQLTPNPISVPPGGCVPVQYKVFRPAGMPVGATSCYSVTITNIATNKQMVNIGTLYAARQWCNLVIGTDVGVGSTGGTAKLQFRVRNTGDDPTPMAMPYSIVVTPADSGDTGAPGVALNGLAPDTPFTGDLMLAAGDSADIEVQALFTEPRAFHFYDVVLWADEDGDGVTEPLATAGLEYAAGGSPVSIAPPAGALPATLRLSVTPNPVRDLATVQYELPRPGMVELGLFDVAGRQVRALAPEFRPAGRGSVRLDCRGLTRGVYFVRIRVDGAAAGQRFVMVH